VDNLDKMHSSKLPKYLRRAWCDVKKIVNQIDNKIDSMQDVLTNVSAYIHTNLALCQTLSPRSAAEHKTSAPNSARQDLSTQSREKNVILFGVPENKIRSQWNRCVVDILDFVAGRRVEIEDAFRLGVFCVDKCRPVLVKLKNVWDRRLVLSNSYHLQSGDDVMKKVFVAADEPVDVRRKKVLARLKRRAVENKQHVVEGDNDCLYVDGQLIYSVKDGKVGTVQPDHNG